MRRAKIGQKKQNSQMVSQGIRVEKNVALNKEETKAGGLTEKEKYVYDLVNGWIENADNKVNISCGIFSGVFGVITFLSERLTESVTVNECWRKAYHVCFAISLLLMISSIFFYVLAINPNLSKSGGRT